ncbi:U1 snRNA associated protein, putative [Plasmodium knowlesi strain H]|uniref:U1 snRNA associated protein, putative n=3 Tax=Plasmodium knowlesi TaxID=5850 RepID=A0A5E7X3P2_PLAKH|nr:U1 snRNP-associated protein, putative [Plasmodium knowlesi strain H]CAA9989622.1 U1 snRNP-associated protein, putative [Plasmodium knowlesi strain H]SBO22706.1 U1 snRNA associated protein, putative [Plasmodium knowlesi strain H]SBO23219.1 U1 snRNA associated protein, putative [Plasmodium knowlesi strain H]VVS79096.1 U1 snRNP-associated protein, putative [Plasmodium knowlesi strain H]
MEEMRSLLDSLMGKDRNETDAKKKHTFKDDNVCKYYLIDFCPHDLFPNTKSDIGRCKNIHSEVLKEQLQKHENYKYYLAKYQQKFMETLESIIELADHKIERSKEKLRYMTENSKNPIDKKEKIESISSHIEDLQKKEEEAREKGDIIKADSFSSQVTTLQAEIKRLNEESEKSAEPNLKVCEICGAMKSTGEHTPRLENHANGKQHLGFEKIRNALSKLKESVKEREKIIEKYRKEKYAHDGKSSKRERSPRHREHRKRSSSHRRSSKHHRSHDRNSGTYQSNRSKRSRKHSSSHRSISSSSGHSRERHKGRSSRHK